MSESPKRQPTRWDTKAKRLAKRTTERDKQAILREFESRMAGGEPGDDILNDLALRHERSLRQIERYLAAARASRDRQLEEQALSLLDRARGRLGRGERAHHRLLRRVARRLETEVRLPTSRDVYNIQPHGTYSFHDRTSWTVAAGNRVEVFLPLERPGQQQLLYACLMEHLSCADTPDVPAHLDEWRGLVATYLEGCYHLLALVTAQVETMFDMEVAGDYREEPAVLVWFPTTVCFDAVERARGDAGASGFDYRLERPGGLYQLRFGAYAVSLARSAGEHDRYRSEHLDLRERWAPSQEARDIAALCPRIAEAQAGLAASLQRFSYASVLPGSCQLCAPAAP